MDEYEKLGVEMVKTAAKFNRRLRAINKIGRALNHVMSEDAAVCMIEAMGHEIDDILPHVTKLIKIREEMKVLELQEELDD